MNETVTQWLVIGAVVYALGFLLQIATAAVALAKINKAQKREVSFAEEFATRSDVRTINDRVSITERTLVEIRQEMKTDLATLQREGSARAASIYKHVEEVRTNLAAHIERVDDKLDQVPHQTVAMLRATKGLIS
jgi:hypothetical protein